MSDNSLVNSIKKAQAEGDELREKEFQLRKTRVEVQHKELKIRQAQEDAFENLAIGENIESRAKNLSAENKEYVELARTSATFLSMDVFKSKVALFPRNIILLGAETGTGKSTTVANFTESYVKQGKRVLIITNEEYPTDILNRIIFLIRGWAYTDHDDITDEQLAECNRLYPILMKRIEIIDDKFNGVGGTTTTLEGIQSICSNLEKVKDNKNIQYDAILIDYIQNIKHSTKTASLDQWKVLDRLGAFLDGWKAKYPAPILLFSQLKDKGANSDANFKDRIEKFKAVMNHATTAIEVEADRENLRTKWIFRKNRFKGAVGVTVITGYDKGRYIPYDQEFMNKVRLQNEKKKHLGLMGNIFKKED